QLVTNNFLYPSTPYSLLGESLSLSLGGTNLIVKKSKDREEPIFIKDPEIPVDFSPWFVAGFTEAEGCFEIDIIESESSQTGISVIPRFKISTSKKEIIVLHKIKTYFNCGNIKVIVARDQLEYIVSDLNSNLNIIMPFFKKYSLRGTKLLDFLDWVTVLEMIKTKEHLTTEGLDKIRSIKAFLNKGRIFDIKMLETAHAQLRTYQPGYEKIDPNYVSGLFSAVGYLSFVSKIEAKNFGRMSLGLLRHSNNKLLLQTLEDFFNIPNFKIEETTKESLTLKCGATSVVRNTLLPFFTKYPIYGTKAITLQKLIDIRDLDINSGRKTKTIIKWTPDLKSKAVNILNDSNYRLTVDGTVEYTTQDLITQNLNLQTQKNELTDIIQDVNLIYLYKPTASDRLNIPKLVPMWVTGFTDGEGCFTPGPKQRSEIDHLSITFNPSFQIGLKIKDIEILYRLEEFFGVGQVTPRNTSDMASYDVNKINDLNDVIIPHFIKFPLQTQKRADFDSFIEIVKIIVNKEHKTEEGILKMLAYADIMNNGLNAKFKKGRVIETLTRKVYKTEFSEFRTIDPHWISGFTEGDASLSVHTPKKGTKIGAIVKFRDTQNIRDLHLLQNIAKYLGCGKTYLKSCGKAYDLEVAGLQENLTKLIPFFKKYPLIGVKHQDFLDYSKVAHLIRVKAHFSPEGMALIQRIKENMNSHRIPGSLANTEVLIINNRVILGTEEDESL
uniref:LAGLIDADG homing endonuclease n=1 Tax=Cyathus jiayuguanensis TaxID=380660 RepID=UPI0023F09034